jgi:hypothetical protein
MATRSGAVDGGVLELARLWQPNNRREIEVNGKKPKSNSDPAQKARGGWNGAGSVREAGLNSCLPSCYMRSFLAATSCFSWRTLREPPRQKVLKTTMKGTIAFASPE